MIHLIQLSSRDALRETISRRTAFVSFNKDINLNLHDAFELNSKKRISAFAQRVQT